MTPDSSSAVSDKPEPRNGPDADLGATDSIGAAHGAVDNRSAQGEFLARGEQAWRDYLRTGQSRRASEVFDGIQKHIDARRQELLGNPGQARCAP